jgi:hypothetical protein
MIGWLVSQSVSQCVGISVHCALEHACTCSAVQMAVTVDVMPDNWQET